jgi:hypothetical protein
MEVNLMERQRHLVVIVDDEFGCAVAPPSLLAAKGDEIVFLNQTNDTVSVQFAKGHPFESPIGEVGPGLSNRASRTVVEAPEIRSYPYHVKCLTKDQYASASIPRIIIHPMAW